MADIDALKSSPVTAVMNLNDINTGGGDGGSGGGNGDGGDDGGGGNGMSRGIFGPRGAFGGVR